MTSSFRTRGTRRPRQAITGPQSPQLVMAAPYSNDRGSRMELADRRSLNVACDCVVFFTTGLISPNSTRGLLVNLLSPGDFPEGSRLFSSLVRRCNGSPCDLTETPEHVSVTPIVRFQTSNEGAFLCRNLSAKTAKAQ